jgi:hypothetical protein
MENNNATSKVRFTTYIPENLKEAVVKLSEETRIPQARLFEEAVEDLLEKYNLEKRVTEPHQVEEK